jgi:hypothetical protein
MPVSKSLHTYPEEIWQVCEAVSLRKETQVIPDVPRSSAYNMRQRFYGFRKALDREQRNPQLSAAWKDRVERTLIYANDVVFIIEGDGPRVTIKFMHKNLTPMAKLLAKRVGTGQVAPDVAQKTLDEMAERLKLVKTVEEDPTGGKYG